MKNEFIKNLKRIMFEKNITQKDLAKKLKTTQSFISTYKTGARNPKYETIEKIAKALDVPVEQLSENNRSEIAENKNIDERLKKLESENKNIKNIIKRLEGKINSLEEKNKSLEIKLNKIKK